MPDHFTEQFAPMPALQAILDATTTLRAGALVFDNDYKHPAILAKELATMDVLSDGRVEIGLGAGWMISDYEQLGLPYDRAGVRLSTGSSRVSPSSGVRWGRGRSRSRVSTTVSRTMTADPSPSSRRAHRS